MKKLGVLIALTVCSFATLAADIYWIANTSSNWNLSANWSYTSGGSSCGCIPGTADVVIFDGASGSNGNSSLDIAPSIGALQLTGFSGTIDLNGFNLTPGSVKILLTGSILLKIFQPPTPKEGRYANPANGVFAFSSSNSHSHDNAANRSQLCTFTLRSHTSPCKHLLSNG